MEDNYREIKDSLVKLTAKLFNKKEEEIIVDFEEFQVYEGKRDILVRAETSRKNIELLNEWSNGIKKIILDSNLNNQNLLIGIKTFVNDSNWQEFLS